MERLFEAGPTNVRFKVCDPKGRDMFWYRKAAQPAPLAVSGLGAPSNVTAMVAGSAGEGPLICMYVPISLTSI
jgi:hypothetical protein